MTSLTKAPLLFAFFLGVVRSQDPATDPIAADGNNSDTENEASDTKLPSIDPGLPIPTTLSSSVDGPFPTSSEPTAEPLETSADLPASSEPTAQPLETPTAFSTSLEPTAQPFESSTALSTPSEQTLETIATPYPTPTPTPSIPVPTESSGASILVSPSYSSSTLYRPNIFSSTASLAPTSSLGVTNYSSIVSPTPTDAADDNTIYFPSNQTNHTSVIVGSVVGGVVGLVLLGAFFTWLRRRGLRKDKPINKEAQFFDSQDNTAYDISPPLATIRINPESSSKLALESPRRLVPPKYPDFGTIDSPQFHTSPPHQVMSDNSQPSPTLEGYRVSLTDEPARTTKHLVNSYDPSQDHHHHHPAGAVYTGDVIKPNCADSNDSEKQLVEDEPLSQKPNEID